MVAAVPLGQVDRGLAMAADRWLVQRSMAGELLVVDAHLEPVWRLQLPAPDHKVNAVADELSGWEHQLPYPDHGTHAVTDDLSLVALTLRRHLVVLDGHGQQVARFPHQPWQIGASGCCAFSRRSRYLWAIVPPRPQESPSDELWLIDLTAMSVVDRRSLDVTAAGCQPVHHPDGRPSAYRSGRAKTAPRSAGREPTAAASICGVLPGRTGC
jgi:hypothetical protein